MIGLLMNGKYYEARVNCAGEKPISKRFKSKSAATNWKRGIDTSVDDGNGIYHGHPSAGVLCEQIAFVGFRVSSA